MSTQSAVIQAVHRLTIAQYPVVASIMLLAADYCITFPREVDLIWRAVWSPAKIIFLFTRYTSLFAVLEVLTSLLPNAEPTVCLNLYMVSTCTGILTVALADVVLCIRTYAIWGRSKLILIVLVIIFTACVVPEVAIHIVFLKSIQIGPAPLGIPGCYLAKADNVVFWEFVIIVVLETVIMLLTLVKAVHHFRGSGEPTALITTLYKDGLLYYVYITAISLANILVLALAPIEYTNLISSLWRVLHTILPIRAMLHLREMSGQDRVYGSTVVSFPLFNQMGAGQTTNTGEELELSPTSKKMFR